MGVAQFMGGNYCRRFGLNPQGLSCMNGLLAKWQTIYVDALQQRYPRPQYSGLNVLGAGQVASGVVGAKVGSPALNMSSNCAWYTYCVHSTYGTPAANAIGQEFWNQWLKDIVNPPMSSAII